MMPNVFEFKILTTIMGYDKVEYTCIQHIHPLKMDWIEVPKC